MAGPAVRLVERVEPGREFVQDHVPLALDGPQGMIRRHGGGEVEEGQKLGLNLGSATPVFQTPSQPSCSKSQETFSTAW